MPPSPAPGTPGEWLDRARGRLALARQPLPSGGYWEDLCYMAQQAAELAIKAVYQQKSWRFAFVHDIGQLLDELAKRGLAIPDEVQEADQLSVYATQARYPGIVDRVNEADCRRAVAIAESIVRWAETLVA